MFRQERAPSVDIIDEFSPLLGAQPYGEARRYSWGSAAREARRECAREAAAEQGLLADESSIEDDPWVHEDVPEELSTLKLLIVLGSVWFGCFLAALDSTIVATLSGPISVSFDSMSLLSWLASSYFIANAAFQPLTGRLTDLFGRRPGLIISNIFFAVGNLMCGVAKTESVMIAGRVVAGIGGGGLPAIAAFVASDLIPVRKRGVWQGFSNIFYALGAGLGGVFGGWVNDHWGWRTAFLALVPLTIISMILVLIFVRLPHYETPASERHIDFIGALTLVVFIVSLLFGINLGGNQYAWTHPFVICMLVFSLVVLVAFVVIESSPKIAPIPVIPVRLLLNRTVASACLTNWFTTMAVFANLFYVPLFFQLQGASATGSGFRLIPQAIGAGIGSLGSGLIMKKTGRYFYLCVVTMIALVASNVLFATLKLDTPGWQEALYFLLSGTAYGAMLTITLVGLIAAVSHKNQAVITSASYAFRSTGSTLGITICSAVYQNVLGAKLLERLADFPDALDILQKLRDGGFEVISQLPVDLRPSALLSYVDAFQATFWTTLGLSAAAAVVSLFMKEVPLSSSINHTSIE